jgi:hypothetical protein
MSSNKYESYTETLDIIRSILACDSKAMLEDIVELRLD